ncbi:MAG TPA: hypothetical protein VKR79_03470 [Gaiellaceae bacterium]|nr:hypothetical protein [Gaiellaceae bacterium]
MRIGTGDIVPALLAAALAALIGVLLHSAIYGVVALVVLAIALLGVSRFRQRPIKVGEIVMVESNFDEQQLVQVEDVSGETARVLLLGYPPYLNRFGRALNANAFTPRPIHAPYVTLRRLTAKERLRRWLLS